MSEAPQLPGAKAGSSQSKERFADQKQSASAAVDNAQFTTSGSLVDLVDKKVLVVLRDQRNLVGVLRSYDQYANFVLQGAIERFFAPDKTWSEVERGIYLIRGENVLLMGEVDLDLEDIPLPGWRKVAPDTAILAVKQEQETSKRKHTERAKFLMDQRGFSEELAETA